MSKVELYIFLEGKEDTLFFRILIRPILLNQYRDVKFVEYSQKDSKSIQKKLMSFYQRPDLYHYLIVHDLDENPCVSTVKQKIELKFNLNHIFPIVIVKMEIESWYFAGISEQLAAQYKISTRFNTEKMSKEQFKQFIPAGQAKSEFMQAILEDYDIEKAKSSNTSFRYFLEKYG
ncbi:MAG: hypothetical protein HC892_21795 [Saprospiraceae bacterium]|nr:hypothetical protein [Saprospiraceae bacterium]